MGSLVKSTIDLAELSLMLARVAADVGAIAGDRGFRQRAMPPVARTEQNHAALARKIYQSRRARDRQLGENGDLLGEPAWDMLLYLYAEGSDGGEVSVTSACHAAGCPLTTGLRHLARLEARGLLTREPDPFDGRRHILSMTEAGIALMEATLAAAPLAV